MADTHIHRDADVSETGALGWFIALVVLLAVVIGGIVLWQRGFAPGIPEAGTNVEIYTPTVNQPDPITPGTDTL